MVDDVEWLDASKISSLHLCPRKYYYRYEQHLVPKGIGAATPANFGTAIHAAVESLYTGDAFKPSTCPCPDMQGCELCNGEPLPTCFTRFLILYPENPENEKDPRTRLRGLAIIKEYVNKWRTESFHPIAVEVPFEIQFIHRNGARFKYIGRIDLVCKSKTSDEVYPRDTKTTSRFGDLFESQFRLSIQVTGYTVALEEIMQLQIPMAQIDAIRTTVNITDDSFMRIWTTRTPEDKEEWRREVESAYDHINHYRAIDFWPKHAPFACYAYFTQCAYWALCTSGASQREQLKEISYERKPWHPFGEVDDGTV